MYNYPERVRPTDAQIVAALPESNYRHLHLDAAALTVFFDHDGVRIDFGGIGKGYAVDRGIAVLQGLGITRAMVNAGGDSRIIGDRFGKPWIIGIRDPDDRNRTILKIPLTDTAFSTSGDYERFFDEGVCATTTSWIPEPASPRTRYAASPSSAPTPPAPMRSPRVCSSWGGGGPCLHQRPAGHRRGGDHA